jgi:hypothetical protein
MVWPILLSHRSDDERQESPLQSQGQGEGWNERPNYQSKRPDGIHARDLSKWLAKQHYPLFPWYNSFYYEWAEMLAVLLTSPSFYDRVRISLFEKTFTSGTP